MFSQWARWGKTSVQTFSNRFLKTLTEVAVAMEVGGLFQYFITLTEKAVLGRAERKGGKTGSDQYPKGHRISWRR